MRKAAEETSKVDVCKVLSPAVQGCRNRDTSAPLNCCKSLLARPVGPASAPILKPITGNENLESETPTALSRTDVEKRCGPSETAQCAGSKEICATEEGRCRNKFQVEVFSKPGPVVGREELLWNGLPGSSVHSEIFYDHDKPEEDDQSGFAIDAAHQEDERNDAIFAIPTAVREVTGEQRGSSSKTATLGAVAPTYHALTSTKATKGGSKVLRSQSRGWKTL